MHDRNNHLGNVVVSTLSNRRVWWSCPKCPDGCSHIWEAIISSRSRGTGCPFCSGQKVCQHNSLATKAPEVAHYWHPDKNLPLSPDTVTAHSKCRAHWLCPACKHEWQTSVYAKVNYQTVQEQAATAARMASGRNTQPLLRLSTPCCPSGITA